MCRARPLAIGILLVGAMVLAFGFTSAVGLGVATPAAHATVLEDGDGSDTGGDPGGAGTGPADQPQESAIPEVTPEPSSASSEADTSPETSGQQPGDAPSGAESAAGGEPDVAASDDPSADDPTDEGTTDDPSADASTDALDESAASADPSGSADASGGGSSSNAGQEAGAPAGTSLSISVRGAQGTPIGQVGVQAVATGLQVNSRYCVWVMSSPQLLATGAVDAAGSLSVDLALPADLPPGEHTVILQAIDAAGAQTQTGTGISVAPDGTLFGVRENVDVAAVSLPVLPANPKAPPYPVVVPLDSPTTVVTTAIAGLTVATVAGASVGAAAAGGMGSGSRPSQGGGDAGGLEAEVRRRRRFRDRDRDRVGPDGSRRAFIAQGSARGDRSRLYRAPGLAAIDAFSVRSVEWMSAKSPLLARTLGDAAPLRAMFGSLSALVVLAGVVLGVIAGVGADGIAQPAAAGLMAALILISIVDALAGLLGAVAFSLVVVFTGGVIELASVRTLAGIVLLIVGPGLIGSSFRDIRRRRETGSVYVWERLTDLVVVPLMGAWVAYNIVLALPGLSGSAFPLIDSATLIGAVVLVGLVLKVLIEEAAARWFPERMETVVADEPEDAPAAQRIISAFLRAGAFAFVSAAFVGNSWQLWVASVLFLLPVIGEVVAQRWKNRPGLWQVLPEGVPLVTFMLLISAAISAVALSAYGNTPTFALMAFVFLAVPGFILGMLGTIGREARPGDTRWYQRPSMTVFYRVAGVIVLLVTAVLASRA